MSYVVYFVEKRFVYEAEKFRFCEIFFESFIIYKEVYRGLMGELVKSLKFLVRFCVLDTFFFNITEFRDKY